MAEKTLPFTKEQLEGIIAKYPTPFILYDEAGIRGTIRSLYNAFSWNKGFKEFLAVKAVPLPKIMRIAKEEGCGFDCSSMTELIICERLGYKGEDIMFSSNNTPNREFKKSVEMGAIVNLDDITFVPHLIQATGMPELISFRYNPGDSREGGVIGNPVEQKYGVTDSQVVEAYRQAKAVGAKRFGIHAMVASNALDPTFFGGTVRILAGVAHRLKKELGINLEFINFGGGIGVAYKPEQTPVDFDFVGSDIKKVVDENGLGHVKLYMENGRVITGPHGWLITTVRHFMEKYKKLVGVDANSPSDMARPAAYEAYHHILVPGKEHLPHYEKVDVVGSLCENNDKFAIDRMLQKVVPGDILAICDSGAHGRPMASNYNGKTRCGELLLKVDGNIEELRKPETEEDIMRTLIF